MIGIQGWGCYLPRPRLTGELMAGSWGGSSKGSRSVANHDEDAVTMAAEAALECLEERDPAAVDRLYLASTTAPYAEHQNSAIVAAVADMPLEIMAADMGGSVRAGTMALRAAHDAIKADEAREVMVCASDMRMALPGDPVERTLGDGAAAFIIGSEKPVAVFRGFYSASSMFLDHWRLGPDRFIRSGDAKFITEMGIMKQLPRAAERFLESADLAKEEITMVVYYAPDMRSRKGLDKKLGFKEDAYLNDNPQAVIGNTGNAQVFLGILAALEQSSPGDKIMVINHSSGGDAFLLEVTDEVKNFKTSLKSQVSAGMPVKSYARFLAGRGVIPSEDINVWSAFPVLWREEDANVRRLGKRCNSCGAVQYPPRYKCWQCGSEDFENMKIARAGKVFTYTLDSLPPNPDPPTPMVSVDLDGGGRLYTQMTDVDPEKVEIGMEVEMVIRRLHQGGGYNNYFWKFRPKEER